MAMHGEKTGYGSQSHVRTACEACHQRKIRCILSTEGGPCQNCRARSLSCFFLPRYRSGRPRSIRLPSPEGDITGNGIQPSGPAGAFSPLAIADNSRWSSGTSTPIKNFAGNSFPAALPDPVFSPSELQLGENGYNWQSASNDQVLSGTFANTIPEEELAEATFLNLEMPGQTWSSSSGSWNSSPETVGLQNNDSDQETLFASLLEHCKKLHQHLLRTRDNVVFAEPNEASSDDLTHAISQKHLQDILKDIDSSCHAMFIIQGESESMGPPGQARSDPDSAARALITAIILKVFQVCDSLLESNMLNGNGLNNVLLQKRLDFNITQASIVMTWVEQMAQREGVGSKEIEKRAEAIAKRLKGSE